MILSSLLCLLIGAYFAVATTPSRTIPGLLKRAPAGFVTSSGASFSLNGQNFKFLGTNAYWLHTLNSDADIDQALETIKNLGLKVVRTWAFNDVEKVPDAGVYFQLIQNGQTTINTGPNGIQRLDKVIELAAKRGLYVQLVLTNNWNPKRDSYSTQNPRNYLSNDYGGMDAYVRQFCDNPTHDQFYTKPSIVKAFSNYVAFIADRYKNNVNVFSYEIANDPRCFSSLNSSPTCNPQTITAWASQLARVIRAADSNHLISAGNGGFFCVDCPKLFPRPTTPAPPATSAQPGSSRKRATPLTRAEVLRDVVKQSPSVADAGGVRIRGRWASSVAKRQSGNLGSAYDGSQGIDSEDIGNIPELGYNTFQYFPDQNIYAPSNQVPATFNDALNQGLNWIQRQATTLGQSNKPILLSAFGIVSQEERPYFVPFNMTRPDNTPVPQRSATRRDLPQSPNSQMLSDAFQSIINTAVQSSLTALLQYQIGIGGLQTAPGSTIIPITTANGQSAATNQNGISPDDGYALPVGPNGQQQVFQNGALAVGAN